MSRRLFLSLAAFAAAIPFFGSWRKRTGTTGTATAAGIHRDTRNTLFGAVGAGFRRTREQPLRFKSYEGASRWSLDVAATLPALSLAEAIAGRKPAGGFEASPLSLGELSRLLFFTNGDTGKGDGDPYRLRAAPSAGALYAGEIYVIAERVTGIEAGVYNYDVGQHELVQVKRGSQAHRLLDALDAPAAVASAPAWFVVTNVFERYEHRYANRGYRYALVDTGHIAENLRLAAASAGLAERSAPRFHDDRLNDLLGIDGREEAVCMVQAVGRPGAMPPPARGSRPQLDEKQCVEPAAIASGLSAPRRYHEATKLVEGTMAASIPSPPPGAAGEHAETVTLPPPATGAGATVEVCIGRRRSAGTFFAEPVSLPELGGALRAAMPAAGSGVVLYLVAHRVDGLAPGIYRYDAERARLDVVGKPGRDLTGPMRRACLGQPKAAEAAAVFLMAGRIAEATRLHGERSYRNLLIEAGEVGQRLYLAAEALGLAARNLAAFTDDDLNALLGLDGEREAIVHLTLFGRGG